MNIEEATEKVALGSPRAEDFSALAAHWYKHGPTLLRLIKRHQAEAEQTLHDLGGCDHSVGLCVCDLLQLVDETDVAIAAASEVKGYDDGQQEDS